MRVALCIETIFREFPFEERFSLVKVSGFDYVEFWTWEDKDIERIKQLCFENKVKVAAFSGDQDFSLVDDSEREKYVDFVKRSIKSALELDCRCLVLHSNALDKNGRVLRSYDEIGYEQKIQTMIDTLRILAPFAEEAGVTLVLEALNTKVDHPGNFLATTKDAIKVIRSVNSPNVKILYDVYHMQIMEGNLINTLREYIDFIGHIHIADVPGRNEPGTGEINYPNIVKALESLNYKGAIGFELFPLHSSKEAVRAIQALF
jgi:hydroxypyruvate isomerase